MNRIVCLLFLGSLFLVSAGCGGGVKEEKITIAPPADPFANAKALLQRYADGQPLTSEVTSFPFLVEEVKKADPAKGDMLEKGLAEIQQAQPADVPAKAKELLSKL